MDNNAVYTSPTVSFIGEDITGSEVNAVPLIVGVVIAVTAAALAVAGVATLSTGAAQAISAFE